MEKTTWQNGNVTLSSSQNLLPAPDEVSDLIQQPQIPFRTTKQNKTTANTHPGFNIKQTKRKKKKWRCYSQNSTKMNSLSAIALLKLLLFKTSTPSSFLISSAHASVIKTQIKGIILPIFVNRRRVSTRGRLTLVKWSEVSHGSGWVDVNVARPEFRGEVWLVLKGARLFVR